MRIIAKRNFISTEFGNVRTGQALDASDAMGQHLIQHGLAEEVITQAPDPGIRPDPTQPTPKENPGPSSQADQVSPRKTAKGSGTGAVKARKTKLR